jgi:hypothetical protein
MTGITKSYIKGTMQLPEIKSNTYKLLNYNLSPSPSKSIMASRTSLFSNKVTSPAVRNRFAENYKIYNPNLETHNYGIHSPNKIYDLTEA